MAISSDGEEDLFLRIVASEDGLEIVASGPNGRREGTIIEPKELIGILSDILNPSEDEGISMISLSIPDLEGKSIDLDLTPKDTPMAQTAQIDSKEDLDRYKKWTASFANKAYFFIDVWDFGWAFSVFIFDDKGYSGHVERLSKEDQYALGITDFMIEIAVLDVGGSLSQRGHYRISPIIRAKLAEAI